MRKKQVQNCELRNVEMTIDANEKKDRIQEQMWSKNKHIWEWIDIMTFG